MKNTGKALLLALPIFIGMSASLCGQSPVFTAPTDTVQSASARYVANIRVSHFKKLMGVQFTLTWNPEVLALDSVGNFGVPMNLDNNFGLLAAPSGILRFAWNEEKLKGVDMKDESILFSLFFRPVGQSNATSPLRFTDEPTVREVVDASFNPVQAEFRHGAITISPAATVTSVQSNQPEWLDIRSAFPNPLRAGESLQLEFFSKTSQPVQILVMDSKGRVLFQQNRPFSSGLNRLEISSGVFPVTGAYIVRLNQGERFSTQKILFR